VELRHLATFGAIVRHGTFRRAAQALNYSQSAVTAHVKQLERDLDVALFARRGKRVALTEAGRVLAQQGAALLERASGLRELMSDMAGGEAGHVRMGAIEPLASLRLPALISRFCAPRPRVGLTLEIGGTETIGRRVASGDLDLGICSAPPARLGLAFEPLFVERLVLLIPRRHPLARKPPSAPADLAGCRLLLSAEGCAYRAAVEQALGARGTNPYSGIEIGSLPGLVAAVRDGLGVAILPDACVRPRPFDTVVRQLDVPELAVTVGLATQNVPGSTSRPVAALMNLLRAELGSASASPKKGRKSGRHPASLVARLKDARHPRHR
jgi:LysR family transcriptional regulator, regulator of the ytmI operon